jgi:CitMHS family citrate-Mg2+:H+ or citrate-Ca2+:H+ symporter
MPVLTLLGVCSVAALLLLILFRVTGFPVSPLTPATFLLVGLAGVDLADHQRRTIPYAFAITVLMTLAALATGVLTW